MTRRRGERGLALVVALWVLAALSLIAVAMLGAAINTARVGHNAWIQLRVRTTADAAIQAAILSMFDPRLSQFPRLDGVAREIAFGDQKAMVSIQDEAGRIDINTADRTLLRDYFLAAGATDADALADRVIDWRTTKTSRGLNGATAEDYAHAGYAYRPRDRAFESVDELALVMGMTPELFKRLEPGLTVFSHSPSFDTRFAPTAVLAAIPGATPMDARNMIADRSPSAALPSRAYSITATATQGTTQFARHAVVLLTGDPRRPYWILDWR
jgi:general secretion pathway protein K